MEKVKFLKSFNDSGLISTLEISGFLILENSERIKDEFVSVLDSLSDKLEIIVSDLEEADLSFIQLMVAFIRKLNKKKIHFKINWAIDDDQKALLDNIGLSNELFF
jgi:hypothetical protein